MAGNLSRKSSTDLKVVVYCSKLIMPNSFTDKATEIFSAINRAKRVLLHFHPHPDPDSVGSSLAMFHYLRGLGKEVMVIKGDSPVPDFAEFLPGAEVIVAKNYLEIEPSEFDLFIMLDISDIRRVTDLGPVNFPDTMTTILIDHHLTNAPFAKINLILADYPATAQILYELFVAWGAEITPDMATCLFLGIYTDTGGFKYPATTPNTLLVASRLASIVPDYHQTIFKLENNNNPESLHLQGLAFSSIQTYRGDRVAIVALSHQELASHHLDENASRGVSIANILKSVRGWDIGITLFEWQAGQVKLSARTRDGQVFDLTKFVTLVGGGGHRAAVGATMKLPLLEAKTKVLEALNIAFPILIDNR